jgi:hypothetical protein
MPCLAPNFIKQQTRKIVAQTSSPELNPPLTINVGTLPEIFSPVFFLKIFTKKNPLNLMYFYIKASLKNEIFTVNL